MEHALSEIWDFLGLSFCEVRCGNRTQDTYKLGILGIRMNWYVRNVGIKKERMIGDYNYIHKYIALGWGLEVQKT